MAADRRMTTEELLGKVRKIEIRTKALSHQIFAGEYHSAFKGRGMAFSEVHEYQYGDDVRNMDWNVTARLRAPYVRRCSVIVSASPMRRRRKTSLPTR